MGHKSTGAANAIAIVAVVGVAVATAALVCVLSVFNGFRAVLTERLDTLTPDVEVTAAKGRAISSPDSLMEVISNVKGVAKQTPTITDQALAIHNSAEMPVKLKGIRREEYPGVVDLAPSVIAGESRFGEEGSVASIGVAMRMGQMMPGDSLLIFAPKRYGRVNMANPLASFITDSIGMEGVFQTNQNNFDQDMLIVDIERARELLEYDDEATAIEIKAAPGIETRRLADAIAEEIGNKYVVKDRLQQQQINFRMVEIEKWVTFLLLFFILIITSFNIISAMTMFVIDKRRQIGILTSLGMDKRGIGRVFAWQSMLTTIGGGAIGMAIGLVLCILQEHYGFLHLNGDASALTMAAYPVEVHAADFGIIAVPIVLIGFVTALIASRFATKK